MENVLTYQKIGHLTKEKAPLMLWLIYEDKIVNGNRLFELRIKCKENPLPINYALVNFTQIFQIKKMVNT